MSDTTSSAGRAPYEALSVRQTRALDRAALLSLPWCWPWSRQARVRRALLKAGVFDDPRHAQRVYEAYQDRLLVHELAEQLRAGETALLEELCARDARSC